MTPSLRTLSLVCHSAVTDPAGLAVSVAVGRSSNGGLALAYRLSGDLSALTIPAPGAALEREHLWAHTCFELFVMAGEGPGYREFNFSPCGQWMRFDFSDYRQRCVALGGPAPRLTLERGADCLALAARLPAQSLPAGDLRLALTAVVERADGSHEYWALAHPPGLPDFHHRDGFALALPHDLKASAP